MTDDELIARYISIYPHRPYAEEARIAEFGVPVWALIGALPQVNHDLDELARAYDIPRQAVDAAIAWYQRHRDLIDARLLLNNSPVITSVLH
jgi:uncharacterized protein (DUF433 family)